MAKKTSKQKLPKKSKAVAEFENIIVNYPTIYTQLIATTVSIYENRLNNLLKGSAKKSVPRHPKSLLRQAFTIAKGKLSRDEKWLSENGIPTTDGVRRSLELLNKYNEQANDRRNRVYMSTRILAAALGNMEDPKFNEMREKYDSKKGSANHSCMDKSALRKELKILRSAMDKVFACDTAFGTCNNNSMASGHCMLSSLIVQDLYGGKIKSGEVDGIPHYWNHLCHLDVDLTGDQFLKPAIQIKSGDLYGSSMIFGRSPFETMNQDFNKEVWDKHCEFRLRVQEELDSSNPELAKKLKSSTNKLK